MGSQHVGMRPGVDRSYRLRFVSSIRREQHHFRILRLHRPCMECYHRRNGQHSHPPLRGRPSPSFLQWYGTMGGNEDRCTSRILLNFVDRLFMRPLPFFPSKTLTSLRNDGDVFERSKYCRLGHAFIRGKRRYFGKRRRHADGR